MVNLLSGLGAAVGCLLLAAVLTAQKSKEHKGLRVGNGAPELVVQEWLSGDPVRLRRGSRDSVVLLVFCSTANPKARQLLVSLGRTQEKHRGASLRIVAIPVETTDGVEPRSLLGEDHASAVTLARDNAGATARTYLGKQAGKLPRAFLINHHGLIAWVGDPRRGLYAPLHQAIAIAKDKELLEQLRTAGPMLSQAQARRNYKAVLDITKDLIEIGARNSAPWVYRFRAYRDQKKDSQRAKETAVAALKDLALRPTQLVEFANQCLLQERDNFYYYQITLMALTPVAHQEPKNVRVQIAFARALAGCGNIKQATAVAGRVVPFLGKNPKELKHYAEQLSNAHHPQPFAKTALAAIDRVLGLQGASGALLKIKYRILRVGMGDSQAARKIGEQIIRPMQNNNSSLNTFAWDLLTEEPDKGKFSDLALIATDTMEENGQAITYYMLDTIALAKFENGFIDEAIDFQRRAIAGGGSGDADYLRRMKMYKAAKRARDKNKKK